MKKFWIYITIAIVLVATGGCIAAYANTLGSLSWACTAIAVATAAISFATRNIWGKFTGLDQRWINIGVGAIIVYPILLCLFLCINYFGSDESTLHYETAVVEKMYSKTRHHTKRISRRTMGVGEPYKVYFAEVSMKGIKNKELSMNLKQWRNTHIGDTLKLRVAMGAFGIPVIKRTGMHVEVPQSRYRY